MSGFQIPGLGQAKPNEVLPPLPQDIPVATASAEDKEMQDANPSADATETNASRTPETKTSETTAMDQESPPSLTSALEATLGDFGDAGPLTTEQSHQQQQQQPALEPDQSEHPEWEMDSSPYESSSESSTSDSSEEESGDEGYTLLGVEETARLLMEMEGGSDDEGDRGKASGSGYTRTKNEVAEAAVPRPDVTITPEMKIEALGAVEHMVANTMLIKAFTSGEYQVLDGGSVLCNADRVVIGAVAETIGKVLQPMYTVMFNSEDEMKALGMEVGAKVYYPVDLASFVFTEPLKGIKGSDASNLHDEEIGVEEMEFSDDEKEAEYRRSLKQKKRDKWKGKEPHPLRQETSADQGGGLNYDDGADDVDDDGPYKPLARPVGYGSGPVSVERVESRRPGGFRGKGRDRGRGGRGRPSRGGKGGDGRDGPRDGYSLPPQGRADEQRPAPASTSSFPSMPNFPGFPWPQPGSSFPLPPPPPPPPPAGWAGQGQPANGGGAFVNPAFIAALMSQMQSQGAGVWQGQQQQHPPPPPGGY